MPRLILSRKGFDSASGGCASPLLPDGRLLSLPIPDPGSPVTYADCSFGDMSALDLLRRLGRTRVKHDGDWLALDDHLGAHLDPDLNVGSRRSRPEGWLPVLGQLGSSQAHLSNLAVGPGDLFLFFGLFRSTRPSGTSLRYVGRPFHALWGWLEIGEVISAGSAPSWASEHPHVVAAHLPRYALGENTLYVAAAASSWAPAHSGAGMLRYEAETVLTTPGESPSRWTVPLALHPDETGVALSYHADPGRWRRGPAVHLDSVGRGQEFVVAATPDLVLWAGGLIAHHGADPDSRPGWPSSMALDTTS